MGGNFFQPTLRSFSIRWFNLSDVEKAVGTGLVSKSTSLGHCFVFLRKAPCSHVVSLSTFMGDNKFTAGGNPVMDLHPIWNGVEIVLVA